MSERLAEVEARIGSIRQLQAVVNAMRGIAATRTQQARATIGGIRAYADFVADALAQAAALLPGAVYTPPRRTGRRAVALVLFTAEHGFVGAFAERILANLDGGSAGSRPLFLIGSRGMALAQERGLPITWSAPMASQLGGVSATARRVAEELYRRFSLGQLSGAEMIFARLGGGGHAEIERRGLLPLDLRHARGSGATQPPLTNLPAAALVERLVGEYVFAELVHAAMENFASENAARLETMESARLNIEDKLAELTARERRVRQEQITEELLDMVAGTEAAAEQRPMPA